MTPIDADALYALLPAIYRLRDHDLGGPLHDLLDVIAGQIAVVQEGIEQAYDDQFIETAAEWVVPYLGDLIGTRTLNAAAGSGLSQRAVVANTLAYRRRKGTVAVLEQLGRDVTNAPAVAVEFFQRLATTQAINHPRPASLGTVDLRRRDLLERVDSAFDRSAHTLEVRRLPHGRYNIPNVGIFLFRLRAFPLVEVTARQLDDRRFLFNPLGIDAPLFNQPQPEISLTDSAGPANVPMPISRLAMKLDKDAYYGPDAAITIRIAGALAPASSVVLCNLDDLDDGSGDWAHRPTAKIGVDPVLGRLALPSAEDPPAADAVTVTFRHGFSDAIGGGSYERADELAAPADHLVPADGGLPAMLAAVAAGGVLEIADSRTYPLPAAAPNLTVPAGAAVEIRAANGQRPLIEMQETTLPDASVIRDFTIDAGPGAEIVISGLLLAGGALHITGSPQSVTLLDCTLVPGLGRTRTNQPLHAAASLVVDSPNVEIFIQRCIAGALRVDNGSTTRIEHSIVDATAATRIAFAAPSEPGDPPDSVRPGGGMTVDNSTIVGLVYVHQFERASNTIFWSQSPDPAQPPVRAEQTQAGCVRFCWLPVTSRTPRRHRCLPVAGSDPQPHFSSLTFGVPTYAQLAASCPLAIRTGADDEGEMGVFHDLHWPQREANLRIQLEEYLRFGLQSEIFYAS